MSIKIDLVKGAVGNSKGLSQDGGRADCLPNISDLSNDATFIQIHLDGQHLSREFMVELYVNGSSVVISGSTPLYRHNYILSVLYTKRKETKRERWEEEERER
jgi:hypothetical protein